MRDDLRSALARELPGAREDLAELIRIPSAGADPARADEVRRSAELTARLCRSAGSPDLRILDHAGGAPAVLARFPARSAVPVPRVLLYAHHDVQPAGDPAAWSGDPFEPWTAGGRLYGRGAADDKAGIVAHLAALRAHGGRPPVDVTVLVEGEEEIGSPTLGGFLDRYAEDLAADVIVLADADNIEPGVPSFTTTLRGLAACVVRVRTLAHGVHSGTFGGAAPDALTALCRLLATLHDERGDVAVAGLTRSAGTGRYPEQRFRAEAAVLDGVPLIGTGPLADRIWTGPAATVLALDAPAVDAATNTLSPSARAKVSLRVAPGDDATRARAALARHLRANAPWGVRVDVTDAETAEPYTVSTRGAAFDLARRAYRDAYGAPVADIGAGGAIPFVAEFAAAFPAATVLVTSAGADPLSNPHGVDESLNLADFAHACLAETLLLDNLGRSARR